MCSQANPRRTMTTRSFFVSCFLFLVFCSCSQEQASPPPADASAAADTIADAAPDATKTTIKLPGDCAPGKFPRLVMCPGEVATARARRATAPYDKMMARVRTEAKKALATPGSKYDKDTEAKNARLAKYAGLVALLDQDKAAAATAIDAISRLQATWKFGLGLGSTDLFIRIVGHLQEALEGFDMVMASGYATAAQRASMEKALGDVAARVYDMWIVGPGKYLIIYCQNNYNTKLSTALGLAALMLDSHSDRAKWLRLAVTESNRMYGGGVADKNTYLTEEGVCKEPPAYFNFGGKAAMPFALLYEYMVGPGKTYKNDCSISTNACEVDRPLTLNGILHSPLFKKAFHWMAKIQMPDGQRPSIDEGCSSYAPPGGALWHYVDGDTLTLWDSHRYHKDGTSGDYGWAGYLMARVDFSKAPATSGLSNGQLFEKSGQAIFRSGWDRDAVWAAVLGERGLARSVVHNHADATSFQLFAFGELLAMDTGYFEPPGEDSYVSRSKTTGADAHNLVLVDGKGAPKPSLTNAGGVDATMQHSFASDGLGYTEVLATYQKVSFARSVLFASDRYLVVADQIRGDTGHRYSWRLHGHGGGSSIRKNYEVGTFTLGTDDALWSRKKAQLKLVLHSTAGKPTLKSGTFPHEWKSGWEGYHSYVDGEITTTAAAKDLAFLAVVLPWPGGQAMPAVKAHALAAGTACITVEGKGLADIAAARHDGKQIRITPPGGKELVTDAAFAWVSLDALGEVKRAFIRGGKTLSYGGKTLITGNTAATATYKKGS